MTEDSDGTNEHQRLDIHKTSSREGNEEGSTPNPQPKCSRLLSSLTVAATVASAVAAGMSTLAAFELLSISKLQHQQEVKRISFFSYVSDRNNWSIKMVQLSGKSVNIDTAEVVPIFLDNSDQTHQGESLTVTLMPTQNTDRVEYDLPDMKTEICRDQPEACSNREISSIQISYKVFDKERVEEIR